MDAARAFRVSDLWEALKARKPLLLGMSLFFAGVVVTHHFMRPSYFASTTLLVSRPQNSPLQAIVGKMTGTAFTPGRMNEYQEKYVLYLGSQDFRIAAARRLMMDPGFDAYRERLKKKNPIQKFIQGVMYSQLKNVSTTEEEIETIAKALRSGRFFKKGFDNIEVSVTSSNPEFSVQLSNFLAESAVEIIAQREIEDLVLARTYVEEQLKLAESRLGTIDTEIVDFRKHNRQFMTDSVPQQLLEKVRDLRNALETAQLKSDMNTKLMAQLTQELEKERDLILSSATTLPGSSDVVNQMHVRLQGLRYKKVLLEAQGEPADSKQMKSIDATIEQVTAQLQEQLKLQPAGSTALTESLMSDKDGLVVKIHNLRRENQYLATQIQTYERALKEAAAPLSSVPDAVQKMAGFTRGMQMEYGLVQEMRRKLIELDIEKISLNNKIRVLEKATLASIPLRWGPLPKFIFAFCVGLFLACLLAYTLEVFNETVRSRTDLHEENLAVAGSIPRIEGAAWESFLPEALRPKRFLDLVALWKSRGSDAPLAMAVNHLRARISRLRNAEGLPAQTLLITSSRQGEGKSFVSANLALSLAKQGRRVLLVDTDFRRPGLARLLNLSSDGGGLAQALSSSDDFFAGAREIFPNLHLILTGGQVEHPTELLAGSSFGAFLEEAKRRYEYVLLDSPPVLPVVDSLLLASSVDGLLVVTSSRKTRLRDLNSMLDRIRSMSTVPTLGVLNGVSDSSDYIYVASARGASAPRTQVAPPASLDVSGALGRFSSQRRKDTPEERT